jgi:cytochrome P450
MPNDALPGSGPGLAEVLSHFDIYDPATSGRLNAVAHEAHQRCPVAHSDAHGGYYLVAGYDEAATVLGDTQRFSSACPKSIPGVQTLDMPPIDSDPPEQREYRRLLNRFFSKAGLARHEPAIRDIARSLVDRFAGQGRVEVVGDFAAPLTGMALCRVILNLSDSELMREAQELAEKISIGNAPDAWSKLSGFLRMLIRNHDPDGRDDVLSAILSATVFDVPLTEDEKLGVVLVLFLGGLDTTKAAIACIVHHLTVNPGLEDRLRATDWTRTDLDEFLRHDSVVTALARTVTVDTELGGQPLKAGDRLLVHYYAANHDPRKFESPDELDFGRGRNPHLAFGLGVHRCIGSNLARLQIRVALDELLSRVRNIRLADDSVQAQFVAGVSRHPVTLPVLFDPS